MADRCHRLGDRHGHGAGLSFLDDHSRIALRVKALAEATTEATWDAFSEASAVWGVPLGQLSDNGLNFSGRLRGFEVNFETQLRAIKSLQRTQGGST